MKTAPKLRLAVYVVATSSFLVPTGCASNLTEEERFERQYAQVERTERIRNFVFQCESADNIVVYDGPVTQKLRDPIKNIPRHAIESEYQCVTTRAVERMQTEMGLRL